MAVKQIEHYKAKIILCFPKDKYLTCGPVFGVNYRVNYTNIFFDKLWKRSIDLLFPYLGNDCVVSWDVPIGRFHDCPLSTVPDYAPNGNEIPDYSIDEAHQVFSLGRGHTEWGDNSEIDFSADEAVLAAFGAAQENIYISQHQLSLPSPSDDPDFSEEVVEALLHAIVDNNVHIKIALSEPWGTGSPSPDSPYFVYYSLSHELVNYITQQYGPFPVEPSDGQAHYDALCRLELGPFRVPRYPYPQTWDHIYHTHNKFFMVDERVFFVGSQNLYPSAIGDSLGPELNEYGFLVDDLSLATQMKEEYWDPIWDQTGDWAETFQPEQFLPEDWSCSNGHALGPSLAIELIGWDVVGQGNGEIKVTWETATELEASHFNIYRNTSPDMATWEQVASVLAEGGQPSVLLMNGWMPMCQMGYCIITGWKRWNKTGIRNNGDLKPLLLIRLYFLTWVLNQ